MTPKRCAVIDGRLVLDWGESHIEFDGTTLRSHCRCAECRYITLTKSETMGHEAVIILAASPLGYGVQLHFSDGHNRGVFPWSYLADIGNSI